MAFPSTPLDVKVELQLAGTWTDITAYTYTRSPIEVTRGRADEATRCDPSKMPLLLNNRDGRFSPRKPTGPYYGTIGRNTPIRTSVRLGPLRLSGTGSGSVTAPDTVGLSVVGDLDVRYDARLPSWSLNTVLFSKYGAAGQRSWRLYTGTAGNPVFEWSADGTATFAATSPLPVPHQSGRQALRATIDVDNGAAGRTITFYTADTAAGTWVQLGDPIVQAGTTSIFDSTASVAVTTRADWEAYSVEVRNGIAGALVGNPIFTAQTEGAASFADAQGNTWTIGATAELTNRRYRFHGEVPAWPSSWEHSQTDVWVPVTAAGITRRLGQGASPLQGPIQRALLRNASAIAYWPCEDEDGSTSIASGLPGGPSMAIAGSPRLAVSDAVKSSGPLPEMALAAFGGSVPAYVSGGTTQVRFVLEVPAAGDTNCVLLEFYATGTVARWAVRYGAGLDGLTLEAYDSLGVLLFSSGSGFSVAGQKLVVLVSLVQNGANIDTLLSTRPVVDGPGAFGDLAATLAARTVGILGYVQVSPNRLLDTTVIGHVMVHNAAMGGLLDQPFRGYTGETAGRRAERLCTEEGITFTTFGTMDDTAAMGVQRPLTLLEVLGECQSTDLGILFESRRSLGLAYRSRTSLYNQTAAALAYANLDGLQPVDDDQATRNDITASRPFGSSARVELTTGALSTQAPPNGVGRYVDTPSVNTSTDAALPDQANWRLMLGTVDQERYPTVHLNLSHSAFAASSALTGAVLDLEIGDLLTISSPPAWLPPGTISQIVQGYTETLEQLGYPVELNCTPGSPWGVGVYDTGSPVTRYDSDGATLSAGITSTATGAAALSIVTPAGKPLWTSTAGDFPLDILMGGERITLSAIAATASPQAATVSARSVNGVIKAHLAATSIVVADSSVYAL